MNNYILKKKQNCLGCGKEYESHGFQILGMRNPTVLGGGYCQECALKNLKEEEAKKAQLKDSENKAKRELWRKSCGIPIKFMNQRFETFDSKRTPSLLKAYKDCLDYANQFPLKGYMGYRSLIIYSEKDCGVGKSHLAAAVSHRILDRWNGETVKCPIKYTTESDLFLRLRNTFNRTSYETQSKESELDVYNELASTPLLIIDDMGKEEVPDPRFVQRVLFEIINRRYNNTLPVIITANLNPDLLERHLGNEKGNSPTFDRLIEMTGNSIREIIATTYRDLRNRK